MTDIGDADLRAVLAVLVSRAGGLVDISRADVDNVLWQSADEPVGIEIESTQAGVRVTVRPHRTVAAPARGTVSNRLPEPVADPRLADGWNSDELRPRDLLPRVAPRSRKRAALLIQALAAAAAERGHGFLQPGPDSSGFCVVVGRRSYPLVLEEQHPRIEWLPDANDRRARQQTRDDVAPKPSGGLVLSMPDEQGRYRGRRARWEDRESSQLDDALSAVLSEIEARAELDEQLSDSAERHSTEPGAGEAGHPAAVRVGQLEPGELARGR
jgi:hypothetical protein